MPYKRDIAKAPREQECRVAGAYAGRRAGLQKDGEGDSESGRGEKRHRKARCGAAERGRAHCLGRPRPPQPPAAGRASAAPPRAAYKKHPSRSPGRDVKSKAGEVVIPRRSGPACRRKPGAHRPEPCAGSPLPPESGRKGSLHLRGSFRNR